MASGLVRKGFKEWLTGVIKVNTLNTHTHLLLLTHACACARVYEWSLFQENPKMGKIDEEKHRRTICGSSSRVFLCFLEQLENFDRNMMRGSKQRRTRIYGILSFQRVCSVCCVCVWVGGCACCRWETVHQDCTRTHDDHTHAHTLTHTHPTGL